MARTPRRSKRPRVRGPAAGAARWRRRKESRPTEIVAAALDVFAERGFSAAKLEDVAARAGVSKGTVYLYFSSKKELFKTVVREALVPNIAEAERMVEGFIGPTPELLRCLLAMVGTVIAGTRIGAIPKLVVSEARNFPELARFYLREVVRRGFRLLASVLERGISRGEFRAVDVPSAARVMASGFLFLAIWKHAIEPADNQRLDVEAFLRAHADIVLRGILIERS